MEHLHDTIKIKYAYCYGNAKYDLYADPYARNQILHIQHTTSSQYLLTLWDGCEIFQYYDTGDVYLWVNVEQIA